MTFSVETDKHSFSPVVYLKNSIEESSVEIYTFGALLNGFAIKGSQGIVDGFNSPGDAQENITNGFKSAKLSPFVCRLSNSKYAFGGIDYTISKFLLGDEAIHGLLYDAVFSIVDSGANNDAAFVTLQYDYIKTNEGFPFSYTCIVTYKLESAGKLSIQTTIKNNAGANMPVSDGWHPYFKLGSKVNELSMEINSNKMVEFDERLLPTGNSIEYKSFQEPELIGDISLDNCFLLNDNNKPACTLYNDKTGLQLTIWPDKSYPYLQLYIPPHRNSIAIENLSSAPDAFNNKMGLIILKAEESISFTTSYQASIRS